MTPLESFRGGVPNGLGAARPGKAFGDGGGAMGGAGADRWGRGMFFGRVLDFFLQYAHTRSRRWQSATRPL